MADKDNDRFEGEDNGGGRTPQQNQSLFLWAILLVIGLLVFLVFRQSTDERERLKQSEFEQYVLEGRVRKVTVRTDPGNGSISVLGEYRPDLEADQTKPFMADVLLSERLDQMIRENVPERQAKSGSNFMSLLVMFLPVVVILGIVYFLFARQFRNASRGALQFGKSRHRLVQNLARVTFADVAGIQEAKEEVEEIIDYLKDPDRFHRLGGSIPKGVLMVGPPGTGKTLLARAIAGEAEVPFFNISGSDFVEMFVGVGASRVRDMFEQAKKAAPCIVFIDEIDAVGRHRGTGLGGGHDEREQTLNALLVEMDGFEAKSGVIVVAATNRPDVLDTALLRPGRFDRRIAIDLPDQRGRLEILRVHARKVRLSEKVDLERTARGTPGFSGADLMNVMNEAALLAARENKQAIETEDLEEARDKVRWGKERRSRVMDDHDREVTAYHEAGHALIGLHCEHCKPLHKITIIPRGNAYLGATMQLPLQDKYTTTRGEVIDEVTMAMGGRCAEEIIFEEVTSGAAGDIRMVSQIARRMVCEWGMSDKVGMLNFDSDDNHIYLGKDITRSKGYSEETARQIDQEIHRIVDDAYRRAKRLLREHEDQLRLLGGTLLERETMDVAEVRELLGMPPDPDAEVRRPKVEPKAPSGAVPPEENVATSAPDADNDQPEAGPADPALVT